MIYLYKKNENILKFTISRPARDVLNGHAGTLRW